MYRKHTHIPMLFADWCEYAYNLLKCTNIPLVPPSQANLELLVLIIVVVNVDKNTPLIPVRLFLAVHLVSAGVFLH